MNGHIKLHRALTEWGWYKDLPTCKLWLHILLRANYKACEWQGIEKYHAVRLQQVMRHSRRKADCLCNRYGRRSVN